MAKNETTKDTEAKVEEKETTTTAPEVKKDSGTTPEVSKGKGVETTGEGETVEVSKDDLKAFMRRMDELEESNKKLMAVADKGRMFEFTEKERAEKADTPVVKLTRLGSASGKLVVAWKMTKNESYVDGNRLIEHQTIQVFFENGESQDMALLDFYRQANKDTRAKVRGRLTNDDGSEILKLEMKDGTIIDVPLKFVN